MSCMETKTLKLLVVEREEIYRHLYGLVPLKGPVELLGIAEEADTASLPEVISNCHPDVLLLGTRKLEDSVVECLEQVRAAHPQMGIVLLFASYGSAQMESLRKLAAAGDGGGLAVFLRQSLGKIEQLLSIIMAANHGQVTLDPHLANCILGGKPECPFLKELTTREMEIMSLLSKGHTNAAIAKSLFIDIKTVEHHLNSIYSKLKTDSDVGHKHLRVTAARLYLKETGELAA